MSKVRTAVRALAGTAVAVGTALAVASPASAHPEIFLACDMGAGRVDCMVTDVGGGPPYTVRWWINDVQVADFDNDFGMTGTCVIGRKTTVRVTVWDSHGSDTDSRTTYCPRFIP
ncbi:hypothetical protein OHA72_43080 [Dactylosporangium sp. NBC_01737]|uniref:hypothetical protein n=1 Tax=Dactylosporangium sp. NBC_01737 TaxID=2975959 RepID=UPI002E0EA4AF|nr:hypothetical protein OHA72_43080 [Dactylosporangium sp. NBC_01737]